MSDESGHPADSQKITLAVIAMLRAGLETGPYGEMPADLLSAFSIPPDMRTTVQIPAWPTQNQVGQLLREAYDTAGRKLGEHCQTALNAAVVAFLHVASAASEAGVDVPDMLQQMALTAASEPDGP